MKTINTKLIAALLAVATVTATAVPAFAQRRSSNSKNTELRVERDEQNRRSSARTKSAVKDNRNSQRSSNNSASRVRKETRPSGSATLKKGSTNSPSRTRSTVTQRNNSSPSERTVRSTETRRNTEHRNARVNESKRTVRQAPARPSNTERRVGTDNRTSVRKQAPSRVNQGNDSYRRPDRRSSGTSNTSANTRSRAEHKRTIYRVDRDDRRYAPSRSYRGSNKYWSGKNIRDYTPYHTRDRNYYKHYNYSKHNHWNHQWENYRWNVNSWRDYYSCYHPHSYQFHKHYYHHHTYGHVIRRFHHRPDYFIHNHIRYYSYNGHFFRHFRGIGYVLVDMPYGIVFQQLPIGYERVHINGYLYFRIGNLFFEMAQHGFTLVHYPERYFALETDFYNDGYYYQDDYY
ncbi:hypothetical protein [Mariniphaga sediminis]|uniref:hypothetical protein n=1 Tax=Mariniphaga sediminis TaxID=1628158 RepID=UPI003567BB4C